MSERFPTLADVCSAIAEGRLSANSDGSTYQLNAFELRRYFNKRAPLPTPSVIDFDLPVQLYSNSHELASSDFYGTGL